MTIHDIDRMTFSALDVVKDFDRGIHDAQTPQQALQIAVRIQEVIAVFQASNLAAHNRADALSGLKERASA